MFEINELGKRIRCYSNGLKPDDLRANFERVQANVKDVKLELNAHQKMDEEKKQKKLEEENTEPLIKCRNVGNLQAPPPGMYVYNCLQYLIPSIRYCFVQSH